MEYENVREALKDLLDINDSQINPKLKTRIDDGPWHRCSAKDIQDLNYEMLADVADKLGMSDLYLDN